MAQVTDHTSVDIDLDDSSHDNRTIRSPLRDPNSIQSDAEVDREAGISNRRVSRRWKAATALVSILCVVAVSVALTLHFAKVGTNGTNASEQGGTHHERGGQVEDGGGIQVSVIPESPNESEVDTPSAFLSVTFERDGSSVFVLDKAYWNHSFIVYPTVVKHSSPVQMGLEHGNTLLDSSNYVFHFERSINPRFLVLVLEDHLTRLKSEQDELKELFEDNQWPGFITRVAIFMETDEAYHFSSDPFLSTGFYVSSLLVSPYYTPIETTTAVFPRNTNLQVEYELESGILIVNYAIGLLPEQQMPQRLADDRLGYFMQRYKQYGVAPTEEELDDGNQYIDEAITIINRRWLQRDEITGITINPIVYYIDPSVPLRWRKYFADGVLAWNRAFDAAGWSNAIRVVLPTDPDWPDDYRIGDLRYNSISAMISDVTYAYGPIIVDPRSGEILHSDITFEYGFFNEVIGDFDVVSPVSPPPSQSLSDRLAAHRPHLHPQSTKSTHHTHLHTQCGFGTSQQEQMDRMLLGIFLTSDLKSTTIHVPSEIIGRHFADIVMHEVGHTLGLRHNFAGSASVTRDQLKMASYTKNQGISTSIMDYLPVNIFSDLSTESAASHTFYQSVIGEYDVAAITYGYQTVEDELLPSGRLTHSPSLLKIAQSAPLFLTDEDTDGWTNPYSQRFDLSSDPIEYANDRLDLIKTLRAKIVLDKIEEDASWSKLWYREYALLRLVNATVSIVQPFLGGVNVTHAHRRPGEKAYTPQFVSQQDQLRALKVMCRIISAESGLFPDPADYASYIQVVGFGNEDCVRGNNDYGCLARGLVNVDQVILDIRKNAIISTLFPAVDRIIQQDVKSPLTIQQVLNATNEAAGNDPDVPRNQPVLSFFYDILKYLSDSASEDIRLQLAVETFANSTQYIF